MKTFLACCAIILNLGIFAQLFGQTEPVLSENTAMIRVIVKTPQQKAWANGAVELKGKTGKIVLTANTNAEGIAEFIVPVPNTYRVKLGDYICPAFQEVLEGHTIYEYTSASESYMVVNFVCQDYNQKPLANERIIVQNPKTARTDTTKTDAQGKAQLYLPMQPHQVHLDYNPNFTVLEPKPNFQIYTLQAELQWIGTQAIEKIAKNAETTALERKRKLEALAADRAALLAFEEAEHQKKMEEIQKEIALLNKRNQKAAEELKLRYEAEAKANERVQAEKTNIYDLNNQASQILTDLKLSKEEFTKQALSIQAKMKATFSKNISIWEDMQKPILAVFQRLDQTIQCEGGNKKAAFSYTKPARRAVVMDVTGSMYWAMHDMEMWLVLNHLDKKTTQYVFFNDGNNSPVKKVGITGGLYKADGTGDICKEVHKQMITAQINGNGGDAPENDLEAVLYAINQAKAAKVPLQEVILIADHLSPPSDMVLLAQIDVPVRVLVIDAHGSYTGISEPYLEIARKTGGSIHTLKEDIWNIGTQAEGQTIAINGRKYVFAKGRFVPIKD
jgi:hypothetical protein